MKTKIEKTAESIFSLFFKNIVKKPPPNKINSYNNKIPFVLIDIDDDDPTRGDTHGFLGLAETLAKKINAEFLFLDEKKLMEIYPKIKSKSDRLEQIFKDRGYPDFFFISPECSYKSHYRKAKKTIRMHAKGIIIETINESLGGYLNQGNKSYDRSIVPHHITEDKLKIEGLKFAKKFPELPKPLVAINFIGSYECAHKFSKKVKETLEEFGQGTLFICSTRRTNDKKHVALVSAMQEEFNEKTFKVLDFSYTDKNGEKIDLEDTFNPYIGLLDQSDHLFVVGNSLSILSEALSTGKTVHISNATVVGRGLEKKGLLKNIFNYASGKTIKTPRIKPINITQDFADKLIEIHRKQGESKSSCKIGRPTGYKVI